MERDPDYPVVLESDGNIKLKLEKMLTDKLYHCMAEGTVFLFYRDQEGLLNCYEVSDPQVVSEIREKPNELEDILKRHSG